MSNARDTYQEYYSDKLWDWLPAIYRELDGLEGGNSLRSLLQAIGSQAALLKRSQDRLWDDMYVELADDWALPYLAELVATRLVSALNTRARRVDIAKTIYYRRRKGTVAVVEQLIADMTGWDGKVVEEFRRLGRCRHGLDGIAQTGSLTQTPEGGWADLRHVRGAGLVGDPFDEFHYTPDVRRPQGRLGWRGIAKLSFHLYPWQAVEFSGVQPHRFASLANGHDSFTFDPSGRDIALFSANDLERDWSAWSTAAEWALPRPITCRLLGEAVYAINDGVIAWILNGAPIPSLAQRKSAAADLRKLGTERFFNAASLHRVLNGLPRGAVLTSAGVLAGLLNRALVSDCGSAALLADDSGQAAYTEPALAVGFAGASTLPRDQVRSANLASWSPPTLSGINAYIDPERGRFTMNLSGRPSGTARVRYHAGQSAPIGPGAYARTSLNVAPTITWQNGSMVPGIPANGILEIVDSCTYNDPPDQLAVVATTVCAGEAQRPYLILASDWILSASGTSRHLTLDGLWLGSRTSHRLVLTGNFEQVNLRYCTLDPGGVDAAGGALTPCTLVVQGFVENLVIERSILAGISLQGASASVENCQISDSIIHNSVPGSTALQIPRTTLTLRRCTVIADILTTLAVDVERLDASDTLIAGKVDVTDTQSGCFRFSARAPLSLVPHPYKSHEIDDLPRLFQSHLFGEARYAQLLEVAPVGIRLGAENGGEIGVFSAEINPIKRTSLQTKVDEYLPFGRLPHFFEHY
ncbi:hypothetical protein [Desulfocastanea catecholica]